MILVTGASGTIGFRLVPRLLEAGHPVRVSSRTPWLLEGRWPAAEVAAVDVMRPDTLAPALRGVTTAFYLVHSMEPGSEGVFHERDVTGARAFARAAVVAGVERVVYLSGLGSEHAALSEHLWSRQETGRVLAAEGPPLLEFRAAMVISRESASFRMLTDLVRRLPAMVLPRWVSTQTQPIALADVLTYLVRSLDVPLPEHHTIVEIGGPDVLTYREMIERAGALVGRRPAMVDVPVLTPRLSSYWTGLTTSVPSALARPLIEGMSTPTVVTSDAASELFPDVRPMGFDEAMRRAAEGE
ncbi:MAG: NAD(P)H-binding protein [Actinomycetota bacterium]